MAAIRSSDIGTIDTAKHRSSFPSDVVIELDEKTQTEQRMRTITMITMHNN